MKYLALVLALSILTPVSHADALKSAIQGALKAKLRILDLATWTTPTMATSEEAYSFFSSYSASSEASFNRGLLRRGMSAGSSSNSTTGSSSYAKFITDLYWSHMVIHAFYGEAVEGTLKVCAKYERYHAVEANKKYYDEFFVSMQENPRLGSPEKVSHMYSALEEFRKHMAIAENVLLQNRNSKLRFKYLELKYWGTYSKVVIKKYYPDEENKSCRILMNGDLLLEEHVLR